MGKLKHNDEWRLPDEMWDQIEPLLPPRKPHPLGCHRPRVSDRKAMDAMVVCTAHGLSVECLERDRHLLEQFSAPALSAMGRGRGV